MKRSSFLQLLKWKNAKNRLPLIIQGARQVGKTHLVRTFGEGEFPQIHEFNFETKASLASIFAEGTDLDVVHIKKELSYISGKAIGEQDLIFFDEIQECPRALTSLKYFAEHSPQQAVIAAGSLLGVSLSEVSFPVGKVSYQWIGPCTFQEFLLALGDEQALEALSVAKSKKRISEIAHNLLWERLKIFYVTGGLPKAITTYQDFEKLEMLQTISHVREIQEGLIRDYQSDFSKHIGKMNATHIRAVFTNITQQLNALDYGSAQKFRFSKVIPGKTTGYAHLQGPIEWLVKAGLIYKVRIANAAEHPLGSRSKENAFKLFPFDIGIHGASAQLVPERILSQDYGTAKGYFAENIALQGLVRDDVHIPFAWAEGDAEIEFLIVLQGEIIPVEVKSGRNTKAKSLASFIRRYSPKAAIKLYNGLPAYDAKQKLHVLPLYLAWDLRDMELL